jgi:hypothetical protein
LVILFKPSKSNNQISKVNKVDVKRKSAESCVLWLESDAIGIISGLVHVEFQNMCNSDNMSTFSKYVKCTKLKTDQAVSRPSANIVSADD